MNLVSGIINSTYIALFSCWTDADVQVLTSVKHWWTTARLIWYECSSDVSNKSLTLHLTKVKPLSIVIGNILSLSASTLINIIISCIYIIIHVHMQYTKQCLVSFWAYDIASWCWATPSVFSECVHNYHEYRLLKFIHTGSEGQNDVDRNIICL